MASYGLIIKENKKPRSVDGRDCLSLAGLVRDTLVRCHLVPNIRCDPVSPMVWKSVIFGINVTCSMRVINLPSVAHIGCLLCLAFVRVAFYPSQKELY